MPIYKIQTTTQTPATFNDVEINGYKMQSMADDDGIMIVTKQIDAPTADEATIIFNEELFPVLDATAFHRHAPIDMYGSSMLMVRDDLKLAYLHYSEKRSLPGQHLSPGVKDYDEKIAEIEKLTTEKSRALDCYRHAMKSMIEIVMAYHFLQSAEALAGRTTQNTTCRKCGESPVVCAAEDCNHRQTYKSTDRNELRRILGDDLFGYYYEPGAGNKTSVRNALMHGRPVDKREVANKLKSTQKAILTEIKSRYKLEHINDLPPWTGPHGYAKGDFMFRFKKPMPDISEICAALKADLQTSFPNNDPDTIHGDEAQTAYEEFDK